jgi:hypothetical protein
MEVVKFYVWTFNKLQIGYKCNDSAELWGYVCKVNIFYASGIGVGGKFV